MTTDEQTQVRSTVEALKLALEALEILKPCSITPNFPDHTITAIREALAEQPTQQQEPEPDRVKFERHWRKTRGEKKANRELPRHPLQPQTYIQDSANRHWVTWQAAVRSVFPPASKPWVGLTDKEYQELHLQMGAVYFYQDYGRAIEAKLREKNA